MPSITGCGAAAMQPLMHSFIALVYLSLDSIRKCTRTYSPAS